jgi:hypothetical protein
MNAAVMSCFSYEGPWSASNDSDASSKARARDPQVALDYSVSFNGHFISHRFPRLLSFNEGKSWTIGRVCSKVHRTQFG